jgi:GxxExxY protein
MIVDGNVVVEVKARSRLLRGHWAQLLNYMRASTVEVGLLLNFGPRPQFKRLVLSQGVQRIQAEHEGPTT